MMAKALMDLRLENVKVDQLSVIEWKNIFSTHLRATRSWLEDSLGALEKFQHEGYTKSTLDIRDYHTINCVAAQRYIHTLEAYRQEAQMLTGVDTLAARPEPALVQGGPSTVYEIFAAIMKRTIEDFLPICIERIRFRQTQSWQAQYATTTIHENVSKAQVTSHANRCMFKTYNDLASGQHKRNGNSAREAAYSAAKTRVFGERNIANQPKQLSPTHPSKSTW
jgi:hypothetical protein